MTYGMDLVTSTRLRSDDGKQLTFYTESRSDHAKH